MFASFNFWMACLIHALIEVNKEEVVLFFLVFFSLCPVIFVKAKES